MAAYAIVHIDIHDPQTYAEYVKMAPASVAQYGGKYIVRGGAYATVEGSWNPTRVVVLEFENADQARRWYNSSEYAPARAVRHKASTANLMIVEGA